MDKKTSNPQSGGRIGQTVEAAELDGDGVGAEKESPVYIQGELFTWALAGQPGRIGAVLSVGLHGQVGNPELGGDAAVLVNPVGEEKLSPFPGELMLRLNDGVEGAGSSSDRAKAVR